MAQVTTVTLGHLVDLLPSWDRSLRAANKAPRTRRATSRRPAGLNAFLEANSMPTEAARHGCGSAPRAG
jgi:hypothetical protein